MGAPKTAPTDASVADFLEAATPDRRRQDGTRLAEIFHEVTGADPVLWGPSLVGYGTYRYVSPANPRNRGDARPSHLRPEKSFWPFSRARLGRRLNTKPGATTFSDRNHNTGPLGIH